MSHTNETTYYNLPQYVGTDIINPLVDTNGAYETIDTVMHNVASSVADAVADASDAKTAVQTMQSTVDGHTTDIQTNAQNIQKVADIIAPEFDSTNSYVTGNVVLYNGAGYKFTANHTGAWTGLDVEPYVVGATTKGLDDRLTTAENDIDTIETAIGNTDISSIGDGSVTGAISTLNSSLGNIGNRTLLAQSSSTTWANVAVSLDDYREIEVTYSNDSGKIYLAQSISKDLFITRDSANKCFAPEVYTSERNGGEFYYTDGNLYYRKAMGSLNVTISGVK